MVTLWKLVKGTAMEAVQLVPYGVRDCGNINILNELNFAKNLDNTSKIQGQN